MLAVLHLWKEDSFLDVLDETVEVVEVFERSRLFCFEGGGGGGDWATMLEGTVLEGTALDGTALEGMAFDVMTLEGTALLEGGGGGGCTSTSSIFSFDSSLLLGVLIWFDAPARAGSKPFRFT